MFQAVERPTHEFYLPGIALHGTVKGRNKVRHGLDSLMNNSKTAVKLIRAVSDFYDKNIDRNPLAITCGPLENDLCNCGMCPTRYTNAYFGDPVNDERLIIYTPLAYMMDGSEPFMVVPPEIALGHELVHAYHDTKGSYLHKMNVAFEEYRTVGLGPFRLCEFTENAIRRDYGVPLRPRY